MERKNLELFRNFIKTKYKFAQIYSNQISTFSEKNFRNKTFRIKSDLAHDSWKDDVLYIPVNLGRVVTRIYKDYVIGMGYNVDFGNDERNERFIQISDKLGLQKILNEAVNIQSSIGYSIIRTRIKDGEIRVELIPVCNYCCSTKGLNIGDGFYDIKEHFIFSVVEEDWKKYFYVDRYVKEEDHWRGFFGEKRDYNANFILSERVQEGEEEVLDYFPLVLLNNDLTNFHIVSDSTVVNNKNSFGDLPKYFNQSDYVDLADIFQEINDRESQISVEFVKNLTSKLSVPAWFKDAIKAQGLKKDKPFVESPDFLIHNAWETPAQYITKDPWYIQTAINDYFPLLLKMIWLLSGIPFAMLWTAVYGGNNPVWTTEKEYSTFYSRIQSKQLELYSTLQRLFRNIMFLDGVEMEGFPTIKFKNPTVRDVSERTNTAIQQMNAWIMSKETAMTYTMGYDLTEINEEKKKINEETMESYARDGNFLDMENNTDE